MALIALAELAFGARNTRTVNVTEAIKAWEVLRR
jgi:hypothetical protein